MRALLGALEVYAYYTAIIVVWLSIISVIPIISAIVYVVGVIRDRRAVRGEGHKP